MSTALTTIGNKLSERFGMGDNTAEVMDILKITAFKGASVSDAQMTALMVVADQYNLNPFTREIYAFPDKGGIVPVVGVDGWSRIINEHPQFDGVEFEQNDESCTCIMYRKDRSHATKVTEWLSECKRENAQPWKSHPKRMLRHKALIQCARLAFGFVGIYDQDEAERIIDVNVMEGSAKTVKETKPERKTMTLDELTTKYTKDKTDREGVITKFSAKSMIERGEESAQNLIDFLSAKYVLPADVLETINLWTTIEGEAS